MPEMQSMHLRAATPCPNCRRRELVFGTCDSKECYSGKDGSVFCIECYGEHVQSAHNNFEGMSIREMIAKGMEIRCECGNLISGKKGINLDDHCNSESCKCDNNYANDGNGKAEEAKN